MPAWLAGMERAWAGIPLIHEGRLAGIVILEHPAFRRRLDWEDFDLFRTAGIQAASYIAEARSQQALADAQRFDEFNRRFAFIMHDIKNLVSQLTLVARNAERHADNPEFRADMIATLQSSVRKMNDLLARLSPGAARESEPPRAVEVGPLARGGGGGQAPRPSGAADQRAGLVAMADPPGLEQALSTSSRTRSRRASRTIRSWSAASKAAATSRSRSSTAATACRPSSSATRLFQPFVSTKDNGLRHRRL